MTTTSSTWIYFVDNRKTCENKKSASMRSKQHPVVLREKLLKLNSDVTSIIFYKAYISDDDINCATATILICQKEKKRFKNGCM